MPAFAGALFKLWADCEYCKTNDAKSEMTAYFSLKKMLPTVVSPLMAQSSYQCIKILAGFKSDNKWL